MNYIKENKIISIIIGASLLNYILALIILAVYHSQGFFLLTNGWESFKIIISAITFLLTIPFFVILIVYFRKDRFILVFAIFLLVSYFSNAILITIPIEEWDSNSLGLFFGVILYFMKYLNLVAAIAVFMDKRYKKIVPISLSIIAFYAYYFASFITVAVRFFFSPVMIDLGDRYVNALWVYMPYNTRVLILTIVVVAFQVVAIKELLENKDVIKKRRVKEVIREKGFMDVIEANEPKNLS